MEVNITKILDLIRTKDIFGSISQFGPNAAAYTWQSARDLARDNILVTNGKELVDYFAEFGTWSREELESMPVEDLNALLFQDIRASLEEGDTGRLYTGADGQTYYYIGF